MLLSLLPLPLIALLPTLATAVIVTQTSTSTITYNAASPTSTAPTSDQYTSDSTFESAILNSTNTYRSEHNATALSWNSSLATYALTWANQCQWAHSHGPNGENLAEGYTNVTDAVDGWGDERTKYDFGNGGFGESTGHFTQLVWKGTTTVGCARVDCAGKAGGNVEGWFVVCEYYPAGNVEGQYWQEVGREVDTILAQGKDEVAQYVAYIHAKMNGAGRGGLSWGSLLALGVGLGMNLAL